MMQADATPPSPPSESRRISTTTYVGVLDGSGYSIGSVWFLCIMRYEFVTWRWSGAKRQQAIDGEYKIEEEEAGRKTSVSNIDHELLLPHTCRPIASQNETPIDG